METKIESLINNSKWVDSTKAYRIKQITQLYKHLFPKAKSFSFFNQAEQIYNYYKDMKQAAGTLRNKLFTVQSVIALIDNRKIIKQSTIDFFKEKVNIYVKETNNIKGNNYIDTDKWITFELYESLPGIYKKKILNEYDVLFDKNNKDLAYHRMLTNYLILVLYCKQPPVRAEWSKMYLDKSDKNNWYDVNDGIAYFNNFKNVKSMGEVVMVLEKDIREIINNYLSVVKPKNNLLINYINRNGIIEPFGKTMSFSLYMTRLLKQLTKKTISINTLRHVYETHIINQEGYNNLTINEKEAIHSKLLHRATTAQQYLRVPHSDEIENS